MTGSRTPPGASASTLSADLSVKGNINATADLHIDGRVEGDINCTNLVQGETSEITGAIVARSARLSGKINGSIACGALVVLKTARIDGDVSYDTLTIEQGAMIDGRLTPFVPESAAAATPVSDDSPVSFTGSVE